MIELVVRTIFQSYFSVRFNSVVVLVNTVNRSNALSLIWVNHCFSEFGHIAVLRLVSLGIAVLEIQLLPSALFYAALYCHPFLSLNQAFSFHSGECARPRKHSCSPIYTVE